ncbi:MAG: LytR/AlgR family response regulator transcription factor [Pyrinomonadaceae bacterium]
MDDKIRVLIVDDEPLARERIRDLLKRDSDVDEIIEAANGREAIQKVVSEGPDIMFLDIQMPDMGGFDVLSSLAKRKIGILPVIIFVTAYDQYAVKAFEFQALDYLMKPFDRRRFSESLQRAKEKLLKDADVDQSDIRRLLEKVSDTSQYLDWITIRKDERIFLLKVEDVCWVEAKGNYVYLKTPDAGHMTRMTINNMEARLDPHIFVRVHRSTIVNVNRIKELQVWKPGEYRVVMLCDKTFNLTRGYRDRLEAFLKKRTI